MWASLAARKQTSQPLLEVQIAALESQANEARSEEKKKVGELMPHPKPATIKVISLWQPWAEAMRRGVKRNETRHWPTRYRGWLAIHAAKKPIDKSDESFVEFAEYWLGDLSKLSFGAVVCITRLVDCVPTETVLEGLEELEELFGNYDENRWAWKTDSLIQLPDGPIPMRGHQGLFDWQLPPEIAGLLIAEVSDAG